MANLDRLIEAGAVSDVSGISDMHKRILNEDFSEEEIKAIIKLNGKIAGVPFGSEASAGGEDSTGMAAL